MERESERDNRALDREGKHSCIHIVIRILQVNFEFVIIYGFGN